MFQIQDIKFNGSISSPSHISDAEPSDSFNRLNEITTSLSLPSTEVVTSKTVSSPSFQNVCGDDKSRDLHRTISTADGLVMENVSQPYQNFGVVTTTLNKEVAELERKNLASSVVKMHFVNQNYYSNSDSTEMKWCDSETSIESSEFDRRFFEMKQWQSNLFHYKRSNAVFDLNHRVQLEFQPLKPLTVWKQPLHASQSFDTNNLTI